MDNSLIMLILAVLGFCGTTVGAFIKISGDFRKEVSSSREKSKKEIKELIQEFREENRVQKQESEEFMNKNVQLLFKRFDDHKDAMDIKFIHQTEVNDRRYSHQNMCDQTKEFFGGMFKDIKDSLLRLEDRMNKHG